MARPHLAVAGAGRPYPGETVSGDAWIAHGAGGAWRLAVVDGLGHGDGAAAAAAAAIAALTAAPSARPVEAIERCHAALRGTRGAVMGVAWLDLDTDHLTWAGIGNVEARLWTPGGRTERPISFRGIVGSTLSRVRAFDLALPAGSYLAVYTDGISQRWEAADLPELAPNRLGTAAEAIVQRWGRDTDDATIVLAAYHGDT